MLMVNRKLLITPRLFATLLLGFSAGLPLALIGSTLQAWFTEAHVSLVAIGTLSLVGIPYTLKFLWAPFLDYFRVPWCAQRQGWVLLMQGGLAILLFILAQLNPASQAVTMSLLAICIAFFSASQDIAIDAYRTEVLQPKERGVGAAYYIFSYRIASLLSGGIALICADYIGWKATYEVMAILLLLAMWPTYKAPSPAEIMDVSSGFFSHLIASLRHLLQRESVVLLLLFIIFYKLGDAFALSLMTNFLLHGLGFSLTEVGLAYKSISFIATVLGAVLGGILLTRWSMYRALLWLGCAQACSNLGFALLALIGKDFLFMTLSLFIENFCSGLSTAALLAFMMSLCHHCYTASQFALLSAIASLGRVFLGPIAAFVVGRVGWVQFYFLSFILCFPGIIFLMLLKPRMSFHVQVAAG
jgi:MFS transporter, PAT family, beta-lactamase induction signal transducer AmpG